MLTKEEMIVINRDGWNAVAHQFFEGTIERLQYGVYGPYEDELDLLGDVRDKTVLEVGCGSGHTLEYLARQGARPLYGVDLSEKQIETARNVVAAYDVTVHLKVAAMEDMMPGLPENHFDLVLSMYALGWTVDLNRTLDNVHKALKPGGSFVFCWEHPIHSLAEYADGKLYFRLSYLQEQYEKHESWRKVPIVMNYRKLGTYINGLIDSGFVIDKVIEETRIPENDDSRPEKWYSAAKARIMPPSFTIKCHKPRR